MLRGQRRECEPFDPLLSDKVLDEKGLDGGSWTAAAGIDHGCDVSLHLVHVARVLNLPELKERLAGEGMTVVASTPEQFSEFLARETAKYNRIIHAAGITAQ